MGAALILGLGYLLLKFGQTIAKFLLAVGGLLVAGIIGLALLEQARVARAVATTASIAATRPESRDVGVLICGCRPAPRSVAGRWWYGGVLLLPPSPAAAGPDPLASRPLRVLGPAATRALPAGPASGPVPAGPAIGTVPAHPACVLPPRPDYPMVYPLYWVIHARPIPGGGRRTRMNAWPRCRGGSTLGAGVAAVLAVAGGFLRFHRAVRLVRPRPPAVSSALRPTVEAMEVERYAQAIQAERAKEAAEATSAVFRAQETVRVRESIAACDAGCDRDDTSEPPATAASVQAATAEPPPPRRRVLGRHRHRRCGCLEAGRQPPPRR